MVMCIYWQAFLKLYTFSVWPPSIRALLVHLAFRNLNSMQTKINMLKMRKILFDVSGDWFRLLFSVWNVNEKIRFILKDGRLGWQDIECQFFFFAQWVFINLNHIAKWLVCQGERPSNGTFYEENFIAWISSWSMHQMHVQLAPLVAQYMFVKSTKYRSDIFRFTQFSPFKRNIVGEEMRSMWIGFLVSPCADMLAQYLYEKCLCRISATQNCTFKFLIILFLKYIIQLRNQVKHSTKNKNNDDWQRFTCSYFFRDELNMRSIQPPAAGLKVR